MMIDWCLWLLASSKTRVVRRTERTNWWYLRIILTFLFCFSLLHQWAVLVSPAAGAAPP